MPASEKNKIGIHCILAAIYFLMIPLTITVNSAGNSFLKVLTIPIGIYFVGSFVFYKKEFHINIVHILLALYTVSTVVTLFVSNDIRSVIFMSGYFLNAALYLCISVITYNKRELKLLEDIQILVLIIVTAIPLIWGGEFYERTSLELFGQTCDPNYFIGFFIFPIAVILKKICESKFRIFYIVILCISLYVVFLSGSRGGLLAIIATFSSFAVLYPKKNINKFLSLVAIIAFAVVFFIAVLPYLPENIQARMSVESVIETRGTYRADIWASMIKEIINSSWEVITGRGIEAQHTMIINGIECSEVAHNHLIQLMYNQGIIGFVTFMGLVVACFIRCMKKRVTVSVALVGMMMLSVSLTFGPSTKSFWNLMPYAAFAFSDIGTLNKKETYAYITEEEII